MAHFYPIQGGFLHEDAFENDSCPSPESRKQYNGIQDLKPGDIIVRGSNYTVITVEMIEAAKARKATGAEMIERIAWRILTTSLLRSPSVQTGS